MLELKVFRQGENRFCNFYADALSEMIDTRVVLSLIHISEPTRPLYISYAVFCLKKKNKNYEVAISTSSVSHITE